MMEDIVLFRITIPDRVFGFCDGIIPRYDGGCVAFEEHSDTKSRQYSGGRADEGLLPPSSLAAFHGLVFAHEQEDQASVPME